MSYNVQPVASVDLAQLIPSARRGSVSMSEDLAHPTSIPKLVCQHLIAGIPAQNQVVLSWPHHHYDGGSVIPTGEYAISCLSTVRRC